MMRRWVAARAPAITSIKILSLPEHYNSDIFTEWDLDVFLTSLLSMLVGVLTRPVDLDVRMTGTLLLSVSFDPSKLPSHVCPDTHRICSIVRAILICNK